MAGRQVPRTEARIGEALRYTMGIVQIDEAGGGDGLPPHEVDHRPIHGVVAARRIVVRLWRSHDPRRERALVDAIAADLLILATSKPLFIPASVDNWVAEFLAQRRGASTAIVASFGSGDEWSISVQESADSPKNAPSFPPDRVRQMQSRTAAA